MPFLLLHRLPLVPICVDAALPPSPPPKGTRWFLHSPIPPRASSKARSSHDHGGGPRSVHSDKRVDALRQDHDGRPQTLAHHLGSTLPVRLLEQRRELVVVPRASLVDVFYLPSYLVVGVYHLLPHGRALADGWARCGRSRMILCRALLLLPPLPPLVPGPAHDFVLAAARRPPAVSRVHERPRRIAPFLEAAVHDRPPPLHLGGGGGGPSHGEGHAGGVGVADRAAGVGEVFPRQRDRGPLRRRGRRSFGDRGRAEVAAPVVEAVRRPAVGQLGVLGGGVGVAAGRRR
mmetsp:Transcript_48749/g.103649  ORF Transcript_48749/g.103649 Transcript_48749/m.103649 type:complete len:289 (+) Transcript_48749:33-899(+)